MRTDFAAILSIAAALPIACGGEGDVEDNELAPPAECALSTPPGSFTYPEGPYGTELGDTFENLTLKDCSRDPFVVGDVLAQSELLLFNVGAGWCQPCIDEAQTLDAEIFREHCGRGLRVVQALYQDERSEPANSVFCTDWKERFGLSFPVLIDDLFDTGIYFEAAQTPLNLIIDRDGTIVFRDVGTPPDDFADQIDTLLTSRGL